MLHLFPFVAVALEVLGSYRVCRGSRDIRAGHQPWQFQRLQMLERNQWLCWAMFSIPLGPEMMPEQSQLQIIPKKDMGHAHRAAGSTGLVVWVRGLLRPLALSPLEQTGMLLYVTTSDSFCLSCPEFSYQNGLPSWKVINPRDTHKSSHAVHQGSCAD